MILDAQSSELIITSEGVDDFDQLLKLQHKGIGSIDSRNRCLSVVDSQEAIEKADGLEYNLNKIENDLSAMFGDKGELNELANIVRRSRHVKSLAAVVELVTEFANVLDTCDHVKNLEEAIGTIRDFDSTFEELSSLREEVESMREREKNQSNESAVDS